MIDDNLEKWESKLTASERKVLMKNLVAEANDLALMDDRMRVGCFRRTGLLMDYVKSECDDDIKPQGVASKIVAPDSYENPNPNTNSEVSSPA